MMAPEHTAALASTLDENAAVIDYGSSAQDRNAAIPFLAEAPSALAGFSAGSRNDPRFANAHRCLTQAIYYEAATEPVVGQRAVAQVVLNRVRHPAFPSTVCGVVYEGWDRPVCQFSFVCDGSLARQPIARLWERSQQLASDALTGHVETSVGSATHYHADYVLPRWAFTLGKIEQIGVHIFYRFPGRVGLPASFTANWRGREWIPPVRRTMLARNDEILPADDGSVAPINALEPDPTDRRAPNDVGGRLDTTTEWRLEIPMPGETSSSLDQARASHEAADEGSR
ncbi:cell wall hydrolase [Aurantiacibacter sp. MUD61]|uniref:cell wall hydrolase n=1 Tax=Aurantiacibacter sp. MUD61 TaxID=3009083 RepID=UPI0022EFFB8A|nr:cell wall hydrolase [Aurantiacibacter sp. MUD61]